MEARFVVGIDAGGTGVRVALADATTGMVAAEDETTADPDGGPAPLHALFPSITSTIRPEAVDCVCAGVTKVSREGVTASWESALRAAFPSAVLRVVPDYVSAFHGALPGGVGVVVAAGTGSVAYGENGIGDAVRVGGRGWEFGDEGSGAHLTAEIVRRAVRACDGLQRSTPLTDAVCVALGADDAGLVAAAARRRATDEGRGFLAPLLLARAQSGDDEAARAFVGAAGWLALLARTTAQRLGFRSDEPVVVAQIGGIWSAGDLITRPFSDVLCRHLPLAVIRAGEGTPLHGAVRLARRSTRIDTQNPQT